MVLETGKPPKVSVERHDVTSAVRPDPDMLRYVEEVDAKYAAVFDRVRAGNSARARVCVCVCASVCVRVSVCLFVCLCLRLCVYLCICLFACIPWLLVQTRVHMRPRPHSAPALLVCVFAGCWPH